MQQPDKFKEMKQTSNFKKRALRTFYPGWVIRCQHLASVGTIFILGCMLFNGSAEAEHDSAPESGSGTVTIGFNFYAPEGKNYQQACVVAIHGVLADHQTWLKLVEELPRNIKIVLLDLPGAVASDPKQAKGEQEFYSLKNDVRRIFEFLKKLPESEANCSGRLTLMGHSYGGIILLGMFRYDDLREQYKEVIDRIDSLIFISTPTPFTPVPDSLKALGKAHRIKVWGGRLLGRLEGAINAAFDDSYCDASILTKKERDHYGQFITNTKLLNSSRLRVRLLIKYLESLSKKDTIKIIDTLRIEMDMPVLLIGGIQDDLVDSAFPLRFQLFLENAFLYIIPQARHSVHRERSGEVAAIIAKFLETKGEGMDRVSHPTRFECSVVTKVPYRTSFLRVPE